MFCIVWVTCQGFANASSSIGYGDEYLLAPALAPSAHDVLVGLDGSVGSIGGTSMLHGVRANLRERGADSVSFTQAVLLVLQNLRDAVYDARNLLFRVEADQLLKRTR